MLKAIFRFFRLLRHPCDNIIHHARQIDFRFAHFRAAHAREDEQIINQVSHVPRGLRNDIEVALAFLIRKDARDFSQPIHEAVDVTQGRPQIVRDGIRK